MKMEYHRIGFTCGKCGKPVTIINLCFRVDGHLLMEGCCAICGEERQAEIHTNALVVIAYRMDCQAAQNTDALSDEMVKRFEQLDTSKVKPN